MKLSEARVGDRVAVKGITLGECRDRQTGLVGVQFDGSEMPCLLHVNTDVNLLARPWRVGDRFGLPDDDEAEFTITAVDADGNALARNKYGVFCAWTAAELNDVERRP